MKLKASQFIHISFIIVILILNTSCKEKPVEPKTSTEKLNSKMLVDEKITTSVVDEDKKSSKEKFLKLKEKLLKPYVLLKKPEEALREFFVKRKSGKVVNTIKNIKEKTIQQQQCNPIYVEMWGLEKYEPRNGNLGVLPSSEYQFVLNYFS